MTDCIMYAGIGTMSTKSKTFPELEEGGEDSASEVSGSAQLAAPRESAIPVIPRHNFGVFSRRLHTPTNTGPSSKPRNRPVSDV